MKASRKNSVLRPCVKNTVLHVGMLQKAHEVCSTQEVAVSLHGVWQIWGNLRDRGGHDQPVNL